MQYPRLGGDSEDAPRPVRNLKMMPFIIALAIACIAFWRAALKILVIVLLFLLASGVVMVIQDMHHVVK